MERLCCELNRLQVVSGGVGEGTGGRDGRNIGNRKGEKAGKTMMLEGLNWIMRPCVFGKKLLFQCFF